MTERILTSDEKNLLMKILRLDEKLVNEGDFGISRKNLLMKMILRSHEDFET